MTPPRVRQVLLVGGTNDGHVRNFPAHLPYPPPSHFQQYATHLANGEMNLSLDIENYYLEIPRCEAADHYVYRHESLSLNDVLIRLLTNYRPGDKL